MKYLNESGLNYLIQKIKSLIKVNSVNGQTGDVTITTPTKTSDLTNDSGFITGDITRIKVVTEYPATEENGVLYILAGT